MRIGSIMERDQQILISELTHGKDLAKQLMKHLNPPPPPPPSSSSSSPQAREYLIQKILSSYEKALSMLNYDASSPCSFPNTSPRSEVSDLDCKDVYKRRKTMPRWTEQVKVCSGTGLEGTLDDGHCWRKYGQKDILGANFPRGYYRCTHRHAQGCLATKQVQRSDADPTIFEVTYRGRHTCSQSSHLALASNSSTKEEVSIDQKKENEEKPKQANEAILKFGTELKVKTEELDTGESIFPSFSFPNENVDDNLFLENNFMASFSPTFISPATSESNYFSMSPCHMNNFGLVNVQTPESDVTAEIISTPTSVTNSPFGVGDFDFSLPNEDLFINFQFDNLDNCF